MLHPGGVAVGDFANAKLSKQRSMAGQHSQISAAAGNGDFRRSFPHQQPVGRDNIELESLCHFWSYTFRAANSAARNPYRTQIIASVGASRYARGKKIKPPRPS